MARIPMGETKRSVVMFLAIGALTLMPPGQTKAQDREMTDQAITDKIEDQLFLDPGTVSTGVDVETKNGIVTLQGTVDNVLARDRAARVAETVRGVRSVVNSIKVAPTGSRTDYQIQLDILAALTNDPATEAYDVTCIVDEGAVTLRGELDSYRERQLARKVAKGIRGVTSVKDEMTVTYEADRRDSEIKADVVQGLRWNAYVDGGLIRVKVDDGRVTLSGTVGSAAEKRLATTNAWVAGVRSVDAAKLKVESWARDDEMRAGKYVNRSAEEIRSAIEDAWQRDPRVWSFNVTADVVGSVATLRGDVGNLKAKNAAEQDARNTVGVMLVENRIKVRPEEAPSDQAIAEKIQEAFDRDPYVERFETTTTVSQGNAFLYGTVDTFFEKTRATELASSVKGVVDVYNNMTVLDNTNYYTWNPYVDETYVNLEDLDQYELRRPSLTDAQLKEAIESELWWSPYVDSTEVNVEVENGIATLMGEVGSAAESRAATQNGYEGGATLVVNKIRVHIAP